MCVINSYNPHSVWFSNGVDQEMGGCRCSLTVLHHDSKEAHYDFGAGPDENLALAAFLRIVDAFERVGEDVHAHHDACNTPGLRITIM